MCITKVAQPGKFLNVQFEKIDFFVFLQNQNKTGSTRGGSTKEARLYTRKCLKFFETCLIVEWLRISQKVKSDQLFLIVF